MSFDQKLKALRLENKMTQEYVARKLNVARSTIAGYETKSRQPSHEKLASLANLFHVSVDYLLDNQTGQEIMELTPAENLYTLMMKNSSFNDTVTSPDLPKNR